MKHIRNVVYCICITLLLVTAVLYSQSIVLAKEETTSVWMVSQDQSSPPSEHIELSCKYPRIEAASRTAGSPKFSFDIDMNYTGGEEPRDFELGVQVPPQFTYSISPATQTGTNILLISLNPKMTYPETIKLEINPHEWLILEPGEYPVTFTVSSGELKEQLDLMAIVTERYGLLIDTHDGRLSMNATAGRENEFTILLNNKSTADLEKIKLTSAASERPRGWGVTFNPEEVKSLPAGSSEEVVVTIKPDPKTVAGSYLVKLEAQAGAGSASQRVSDSVEIRVTALTPTIWGWVGVGIIVLIIVGLVIMFKRLGRR